MAVLEKIVSGGQTGVDRGTLDAALASGFPCGGWCPVGRQAEDGPIAPRYPLTELPGAGYLKRTRQNVIDSDGTLVIYFGELSGGTLETVRYCERFGKPVVRVDGSSIGASAAAVNIAGFIRANSIKVLNVAGPRESKQPGARAHAQEVIGALLSALQSERA